MILSIEGEEACGKTTLAYTAPGKIVGFQFDLGSERALFGTQYEELFKGKEIQTIPYSPSPDPKGAWSKHDITVYELPSPIQLEGIRVFGAEELWLYFIKLFAKALTDPTVDSIAVDTMTIARKVRADAHLQSLQEKAFNRDGTRKPGVHLREQLQQIEYGHPNGSIRDLYTAGAGSRKNMAAVHHLTDEYRPSTDGKGEVTSVLTGKRILEGLAQTYRFVDIAVRCSKNGKKGITAQFQKCGYNLALEGTSIDSPTWDKLVGVIKMSTGDRMPR